MKRIYEKKRKKQKKEMKHLKHFELKTSGKGKSKLITLFFLIDNISHGAMHVLVCVCVWVCEHVSVYACMFRDGDRDGIRMC